MSDWTSLTIDELMAIKAELSQKRNSTMFDIMRFQAAKEELERRNTAIRAKYRQALVDAQLKRDAT